MTVKQKYYERLPRKVTGQHRCQLLTPDGDKCNKKAIWEVSAHLETELYKYEASWMAFYLCQEHWMVNWYMSETETRNE